MAASTLSRFLTLMAITSAVVSAHGAELVTNGNFEAPANPRSGWTEYSLAGYDIIGDNFEASDNHRPGNSAYLGDYDDALDFFEQNVTTLAGASSVTLSFDLTRYTGGHAREDFLTVTLGGAEVAKIDLGDESDSIYVDSFQSFDVTALSDGSQKMLRFTVTTDDSYYSAAFVDNISLNALGPVPEPTSIAALGLGVVAVLRRRRPR